MAAPKGRYSYRTLVLATCLGLALGAAALFAAVSWRVQLRASRQLEDTRVQLALLQVNRRVQVLVTQAIDLNRFAQEQVNVARLTSRDFDSLALRLLPALRRSGDVNYVGVALASTGESFLLLRFPNDSVALRHYVLIDGQRRIQDYAAPPGRTFHHDRDLPPDGYDARNRPYFEAAVTARRGVWTPSYEFVDEAHGARPGVSYVTPLYGARGELVAVVDTDIDTRTLSTFLARLQDRFPGDVFVLEERLDRSRRLIAHPNPAVMLDPAGRLWGSATEVPDSGVRGMIRVLDKPFRDMTDRADMPLRFGSGRNRIAGAFTLPVGRDRPNWLVAVTLPESVALADLRRSQREALVLMAGLAVLTALVARWLSRRLSEPIEHLVREAKEIGSRQMAIVVPPGGPQEVLRLAQVYESLLASARIHRDELAEVNQELRASNQALQREIEARRAAMSRSESLELQLVQSQKFEAIGTMAGGIAHDFNNILTAILGSADVLDLELPPAARNSDSLNTIRSAAERARDLVKRILTVSRQEAPERRRARAGILVEEAVALLRAAASSRIVITTDLPTEGDSVQVDPGQLVQVLLNLGTNAIYAMIDKGGKLHIQVVRRDAGSGGELPVGMTPGPHVEIVVSDTGGGISHEALGRIFDPFFTTKPEGEGTGLGLSIVYGIVQSHGGAITVESTPGVGTTFRVFLPVAPGEDAAELPFEEQLPRGQGQHIAVLDNEPAILTMAGQMLRQLGYEPRLYGDPLLAVEEIGGNTPPVDLLIVDLEMPELSGEEVARRLWARRPELRIILASGSFASSDGPRTNVAGFFSFLTKPYRMRTLAAEVEAGLARVPKGSPSRRAEDRL